MSSRATFLDPIPPITVLSKEFLKPNVAAHASNPSTGQGQGQGQAKASEFPVLGRLGD